MKKQLYHTYTQDNKDAEIYLTPLGFEVDLYKDDILLETRKVYEHSESYAESVADNWVQGILKITEKEGSFYGYNEKSRNYEHGLDD